MVMLAFMEGAKLIKMTTWLAKSLPPKPYLAPKVICIKGVRELCRLGASSVACCGSLHKCQAMVMGWQTNFIESGTPLLPGILAHQMTRVGTERA